MADISDIEKTLVDTIVGVLYPAGTANISVIGSEIRIYRGWPAPSGLDVDLAAGVANISVFSDPKSTRDTTRYPRVWRTAQVVTPTLTVTLADGVATFSGTGGTGQNAGVLVDGVGYAVAVGSGDTPESVAASLAAQIPGATAGGSTLAVQAADISAARVEGSATMWQETRRQEQSITVTLWCADPGTRDTLTSTLDAQLSSMDWLQLPEGTSARFRYKGTDVTDVSERADLYRRDLVFIVEFPTIVQQTASAMVWGTTEVSFGCVATVPPSPSFPLIGAIRFDAWYDPTDTIDAQCAAALSGPSWQYRLPPNAVIAEDGTASWPLAAQSVIDAEILAAVEAGIDFWAFDAYQPDDGLSRALGLYLSSAQRPRLGFCMLGQSSAWADPTTSDGYSATFERDLAMMSEAGYVQVAAGRPLYFVLDASAAELASLPQGGVAAAIATIRSRALKAGAGNPYIVWLSGAPLAAYDNVPAAIAAGADAAGAYATPIFTGSTLAYSNLALTAEIDWQQRVAASFPMVPTAMTGWDQRPLIADPQPFYPLPQGLTASEFYEAGAPNDIATHVAAMASTIIAYPEACPASVGLIYAWNELAEGGWLMPTYTPVAPDRSRVAAVGSALAAARSAYSRTKSFTS